MAYSEIYSAEKEKKNKKTVWEHYFARKIALLIAAVFFKLGISANAVSFLSLAAGISGAVLIAAGNFWVIILGGVLMQVWLILDKTDGIVARLKNSPTKFGEFFEEFNGSLIAVLFFGSIGYASSKFPGILPFEIPSFLFILMGACTSLFVALRHLMFRHFEVIFQDKEITASVSGRGFLAVFYNLTVKFSGVYSLAQPIFLGAVIFNFLGFYTTAYFLIQGTLMFASMAYLLISAGKK